MKINTTSFGVQEIDPDMVITFPQGIPGFPDTTRFAMFHPEGKPTIHWLQSVDAADVAFSVVQPELFGLHYTFELSDAEAAVIGAEQSASLLLFLMVYRSDEGEEIEGASGERVRANVRGPLVINADTRLGLQKVLRQVEQMTLIAEVD